MSGGSFSLSTTRYLGTVVCFLRSQRCWAISVGMAGVARLVVPGHPHYVAQRGGRRMEVFIGEGD